MKVFLFVLNSNALPTLEKIYTEETDKEFLMLSVYKAR